MSALARALGTASTIAAVAPLVGSATPNAIPVPRPTARPGAWIVSRGQDLFWFHGSVLAGAALLVFFLLAPPLAPATAAATQPALLALFLWGLLFDGTHVVGTYARSYLAPDPAARAGLPGWWSLALLAVGPAVAVVDHFVTSGAATSTATRALSGGPLFQGFLLAALLWAYYHLVRQHWGFVALYRRRDPADTTPARLDEALLWLGCLYPFVRFSLTPAYARTGLPQLLPAHALAGAQVALDLVAGLGAVVLLVAWLARTQWRPRLGPKHLLLAIVIAFHAAVFALLDDLLAITATLTIFHNLQYHRIVWQHEAGKGRRPLGSVGRYLAAGLGLGAAWYGARILGAHLAGPGLGRNLLVGLGWGVAFHHYLVDGRIWRTRKGPAVARATQAEAAARS